MTESQTNRKKFHVGVASVFAGLLFFGGLESLIRLSRDPVTHALVRLLQRFIKSDALAMRETQTDWIIIAANLVVGLILLVAGLIVGARVLKRRPLALSL